MAARNDKGRRRSSTQARSGAAHSSQDRQAQEAAKHAPVSLPSGGSFEVDKLQKGLDKAVDREGGNRDAEVAKAFKSARSDTTHTDTSAPNAIPGHKVMKTETQLVAPSGDGKDAKGGVSVTEFRQVADPDADVGSSGGGQPVVGNQSEILSSEVLDVAPPSAPSTPAEGVPAQDGETGKPGTTTNLDTVEAGGQE